MTQRQSPIRHGLVFQEALIGLLLLSTTALLLTTECVRRDRVRHHNAAQLEAEQMAEAALAEAQRGAPIPSQANEDGIEVESLQDVGGGLRWLAVTARHDGRSARLVGLSLDGGTK